MENCLTDEKKEYNDISSLDSATLKDLETLEKKLKRTSFIKGAVISIDDVEAYDNFLLLNIALPKETYPKIYQWKNVIDRMKRNWKISKKPSKGRTFAEYVKMMTDKLKEQNKKFNDKMKEINTFSGNILKHEQNEKEIATIHFFEKKDSDYIIKILVKFLPEQNGLSVSDISSKLSIIAHNHLPNKTNIEPSKNEKGEISAVITSTIDKSEYDIELLAQEIKRNIQGVYNINIISIEKEQ